MTEISKIKLTAAADKSPRLKRELATVTAMIRVYCKAHHHPPAAPCDHCSELKDYVTDRLTRCIFADNKPTCAKCTVHCYKPAMRAEIISVMRFSGPRMIFFHPYLAFRHLLDGRRVAKKLSGSDGKMTASQGESHS